jgi:hypothetical protein
MSISESFLWGISFIVKWMTKFEFYKQKFAAI